MTPQRNEEKECEQKQMWSDRGGIISGHEFQEVDQQDKTRQILRCKKCGHESVGIINPNQEPR